MSRWVDGGLCPYLANWDLHFARIFVGGDPVEVEIGVGLVNAVKILRVGKREKLAVSVTLSLVRFGLG